MTDLNNYDDGYRVYNKRYGVRDTGSITKGMVCGIQSLVTKGMVCGIQSL